MKSASAKEWGEKWMSNEAKQFDTYTRTRSTRQIKYVLEMEIW